jgi:tripartite ATP-independent transporter DctP family solute receptor
MKKALVLVLALLITLTMAACVITPIPAEGNTGSTGTSAKAVTIILGHFGAPNEPVSSAAETFKKELEKLSSGSITVEIHGASELGNAKEMVEQTAIGAMQACLVSQGSLDKYDIRYALVTAPYVYSGYEHAYAVVDGPFTKWVNDGTLEAKGLHNVGPWDYGFRCLTNSVREVKTPADVKGLKIRTPSEVQKVACFESLGADVQQIAFTELITALKQGTVDGQENPLSTIYNNSMWEANQTYLSLTRHTWEAVNLTLSNTFWQGLSAEQRSMIEKASTAARDQMRNEVQNSEKDYIQKLKDKGVTVSEVNMDEFKAAMEPAWDKVAEYEGNPADMDKFLKMVEESKP